MSEAPSSHRNRWMALLLAILFPGLGHWYLHRRGQALLMLLVPCLLLGALFMGAARGFFEAIGLLVGLLAWQAGAGIHAFLAAPRRNLGAGPWILGGTALFALGSLLSLSGGALFWTHLLPRLRYRPMVVVGQGMVPTLLPGDRLMVDAGWYGEHPLRVGDLVVLNPPEAASEQALKRCVALAGDAVAIREGALFVNGQRQHEPYLDSSAWSKGPDENLERDVRSFGPLLIPEGAFFCLGDERNNSLDSRSWGPVPLDRIQGRALYLWWGKGRAGIGRPLEGGRPAQ